MCTVQSSHFTLRYLPKKSKSTCPYKDLGINVHRNFIYNNSKLETIQISISTLMDTYTVEYYVIKRNKFLMLAAT